MLLSLGGGQNYNRPGGCENKCSPSWRAASRLCSSARCRRTETIAAVSKPSALKRFARDTPRTRGRCVSDAGARRHAEPMLVVLLMLIGMRMLIVICWLSC